jgi:DNA-directed RNA polymerase subunit RPC12/RpoP
MTVIRCPYCSRRISEEDIIEQPLDYDEYTEVVCPYCCNEFFVLPRVSYMTRKVLGEE